MIDINLTWHFLFQLVRFILSQLPIKNKSQILHQRKSFEVPGWHNKEKWSKISKSYSIFRKVLEWYKLPWKSLNLNVSTLNQSVNCNLKPTSVLWIAIKVFVSYTMSRNALGTKTFCVLNKFNFWMNGSLES